jgi:RNA polymerase sigma-70 factor (ECF subfamily)
MEELERLYRERYAGFRAALATVTGSYDTARDAAQEGFARALANRHQFKGGSLAAWVWRIAYNAALEGRKAREVPGEVEVELVDPASDPELAAALRQLSPRRRLIVFLRYFADLSYAEIAEVCEVSPGTVAATLAQARETLAAALDTEGAHT